MIAFADTGFYVALLNSRDRLHDTALSAAADYEGDSITTEYILIELGNFLSGLDRPAFHAFYTGLRRDTRTEIVPSSSRLFEQAVDLYSSRKDKRWSLTDCSSFAVMYERNIRNALTFDRHFEQAGFTNLIAIN